MWHASLIGLPISQGIDNIPVAESEVGNIMVSRNRLCVFCGWPQERDFSAAILSRTCEWIATWLCVVASWYSPLNTTILRQVRRPVCTKRRRCSRAQGLTVLGGPSEDPSSRYRKPYGSPVLTLCDCNVVVSIEHPHPGGAPRHTAANYVSLSIPKCATDLGMLVGNRTQISLLNRQSYLPLRCPPSILSVL